jgi:hypothetical protein
MSKDYWKEVLDTARQKLETLRTRRDELDAEREEINLQVVQIEQLVENLAPLADEAPFDDVDPLIPANLGDLNLADACREILKVSSTNLTPIQMRDILAKNDYKLDQYSNPLASIHGVLKRMAESGEIEATPHEKRGTMYRYKSGSVSEFLGFNKPRFTVRKNMPIPSSFKNEKAIMPRLKDLGEKKKD